MFERIVQELPTALQMIARETRDRVLTEELFKQQLSVLGQACRQGGLRARQEPESRLALIPSLPRDILYLVISKHLRNEYRLFGAFSDNTLEDAFCRGEHSGPLPK